MRWVLCCLQTMSNFFQTIFTKITSAVASVIIAVGLVSAPALQPELPLQPAAIVDIKQNVQKLEKSKLEAELKQARAEAASAKAAIEKTQREMETAARKSAEENLRKQQEEQVKQLEQQKIQAEKERLREA